MMAATAPTRQSICVHARLAPCCEPGGVFLCGAWLRRTFLLAVDGRASSQSSSSSAQSGGVTLEYRGGATRGMQCAIHATRGVARSGPEFSASFLQALKSAVETDRVVTKTSYSIQTCVSNHLLSQRAALRRRFLERGAGSVRRGSQPSSWTCPLAMCSALILVSLLGSASAKGYNRSRTKLAIPKYVGSPPANRGPTARIVGGAPP